MKTRKIYWVITPLLLSSCATMNSSLQFGGSMGAAAGAAATAGGFAMAGKSPSFSKIAMGAGIGSALGIISSYFIYKNVQAQRQTEQADQTEMHFGDLPPSPFIVPKPVQKKGAK